ncbi:MAG: DUF1572 family protein [Bacteroidia bacterium]|nr:DUF1572 family protein [Bacteroidia bacterium]
MAALFQFENYLLQLKREIELFPDDESLWKIPEGIANSPGNLALHIAGNLQHFIGANLGHTGYVRQREQEFSRQGLSKTMVLEELEKARQCTILVLGGLSSRDQSENYPQDFKGNFLSIGDALSHLLAHLAYHTGQVNYLRRMLYPAV